MIMIMNNDDDNNNMLLTENFKKMLISYFQNYPSGRPTLTSEKAP